MKIALQTHALRVSVLLKKTVLKDNMYCIHYEYNQSRFQKTIFTVLTMNISKDIRRENFEKTKQSRFSGQPHT